MRKLKIVFMGTPAFAVESLNSLINSNHEIIAVVTTPDKPSGRGQTLHSSEVKQFAIEHKLQVLQPVKLKEESFIENLRKLKADLFVVVAFRMLPEIIWSMPPLGTINLHASLLPQYRGAAPINWAIINGEKETGATTFFISHKIDEGNLLFDVKVEIRPDETAGELHDKLMIKGAELLIDTVNKIAEGNFTAKPQTFSKDQKAAPKIFKETCKINWDNNPQSIHNMVRGLSPYPAAWSILTDKEEQITVKIYKSSIELANHNYNNGTIITDKKNYLKVACKEGFLNILEIQVQGKKRLEIKNFLAGFRNPEKYLFI